MSTHTSEDVRRAVRDRYARVATESTGCCGPSCCGADAAADPATDAATGATAGTAATAAAPTAASVSRAIGYSDDELAALPEDANLGLGCGNPTALAELTEGQTVLDLGSGAGIDCFLASRQVGPGGRVIGVDMTAEMIERARRNAVEGGYDNVEFRLGEIEALPVADATVDVVISNCVLNLSAEKGRVLAEVFRVLRPGGRLVVSDMVSDEPVPAALEGNLDAVAACLPTHRERYLQDFRDAGFGDVRITSETPYPMSYVLDDPGVRAQIAERPETEAALRRFASSISGAHFEATRP